MMENNYLYKLQDWYFLQHNGVWEKKFGVKIDTLDNPGWSIKIDLNETQLEKKNFEELRMNISEDNWILCWKNEKQFQGGGGPENLAELVKIFICWKDNVAMDSFSSQHDENLLWLQKWYQSQCNQDWEHEYGIKIETNSTLDWKVEINLQETELQDQVFQKMEIKRSKDEWISCEVDNRLFNGFCGPFNLSELLEIFRNWADFQGKI